MQKMLKWIWVAIEEVTTLKDLKVMNRVVNLLASFSCSVAYYFYIDLKLLIELFPVMSP